MSDWKLLNTSEASGASSVEFTDLTGYKIFKFVFIDVNPATDGVNFTFQVNATDSSGYDRTMTTTYFDAYHNESDSASALEYRTAYDQAQGTDYQIMMVSVGSGSDECGAGELHLFNPSSTTYVKHFYIKTQHYQSSSSSYGAYVAGYINDTTAIDDIQFKMASGNFDGVIKQYGLVAA